MADEVAGAAAGGSTGGSGAPSGGAPTSGSGAPSGGSTPSAPQSDEQFLAASHPAPAETTDAAKETPAAESTATQDQPAEEINLAALEPGQPEWLAKVTDPAAKAEIQKILDFQKAVNAQFKDQSELDAFFKDLPGGKEQVGNLLTLSKEIAELDTFIADNKPEGNLAVAERYLGEAPDGGVGLLRAGAQHLAKAQPEAWNELAGELINETLKSSGIGADFKTITSAVEEMRQAVANDDGDAFGRAAGKLLGQPRADEKSSADPRLTRAQQAEKDARAAETKALGETYTTKNTNFISAFKNDIHSRVGKLFADEKFMPKSVSQETRSELTGKIFGEVIEQLKANAYLDSQVTQLIGIGGQDLSRANLKATQAEFDKVLDLVKSAANRDLLNRAVSKVVSAYSKERASSNRETRDAAKNGTQRKEVGAGPAVKPGYKPITEDELAKMSDEEMLAEYTKRRSAAA